MWKWLKPFICNRLKLSSAIILIKDINCNNAVKSCQLGNRNCVFTIVRIVVHKKLAIGIVYTWATDNKITWKSCQFQRCKKVSIVMVHRKLYRLF